jgi:hypothetical protein
VDNPFGPTRTFLHNEFNFEYSIEMVPKAIKLVQIMDGFKDFYNMLLIHAIVDATQIHVQKLKAQVLATNYYSFKSKDYNIQM